MENRLKERLTGAAILVALIVLLVPEMFRGQHAAAPVSSGAADGPPLRSYTIDLNSDARTAPLPSEAAPASSPAVHIPAPVARVTPSVASTASATPAPSPPQPHPQPPLQHAPAHTAPAHTAASPSTAAPSAHAPASVSHSVVAVRAGAGAGAGGWSVQLGLFSKRENAQRLARTAQQKGFPVSVSGADGKGLYRVRTSAGERARAVALLQEMKAQGLPGALTSSQ